MSKREKMLNLNRVSRDETAAMIASLRERVADMDIKGRLRNLEDRLAVCPPTAAADAAATDAEIKRLTSEFMDVYSGGVLVERYLERMEKLVGRRMSFM